MATLDWRALYRSLEITDLEGTVPVSKPGLDAFAQFERDFSIELPLSYRGFISEFGPGELAGRFVFRAPGYPDFGRYADLAMFTEHWRSKLKRHVQDQRIARMVYFCETTYGDFVGWDPLDVRDQSVCEYGIYVCVHERDTCDFLKGSFSEFINDICLGDGLPRFLGEDPKTSDPPKRTFMPYSE